MTIRRLGLRLRSLRPGSVALGEVAAVLGQLYGTRPAIDQDGVVALTYEGLADMVDLSAGGLVAAGLPAGQPVLVVARNGIPLLASVLAVSRAAAIPVPVNPQLRPAEVATLADEIQASVIVVDSTTRELAPPYVRVPAPAWTPRLDAIDVDDLPSPAPLPELHIDGSDVAAIFATSGTTGRSKGAELTHRGLLGPVLSGMAVGGAVGWTVLEALPVAHIMGFSALLGSLAAGLHVHAVERFHPVRFLEESAALHPEVVAAVPAMYRMLLDTNEGPAPAEALSSVRVFISGSDVLGEELAGRLRALGASGAVVLEGYGMVELSGAASVRAHLPLVGAIPRGDLGWPLPPWRVRIVDDSGRRVLPFRVGQLEVKGPGVLTGYRGREGVADDAFRNGWLRTGDLASWGPFGLRFAGRSRDVVKVGGYSVFPREVEEELRACPGVRDAAVVGLSDPVKGEVLAAAVEPEPGVTVTASEVEDFARRELASYRRPVQVVVVEELPRNPNRKVVKDEVRRLFSAGGVGG